MRSDAPAERPSGPASHPSREFAIQQRFNSLQVWQETYHIYLGLLAWRLPSPRSSAVSIPCQRRRYWLTAWQSRTINGAFTNEGYACANISRNRSSCSFERFVAMISNLMFFIRSATRSMTASLVIRKRADVPSVTALRTRLMKSSSMP